ncbi:MAG TPA: hypothetical protein VGR47_16055 [Terracidiphilus sp.]|nr:hypothetical protein [Terracidiphilus sp.]
MKDITLSGDVTVTVILIRISGIFRILPKFVEDEIQANQQKSARDHPGAEEYSSACC